jgi:hypothetical protein
MVVLALVVIAALTALPTRIGTRHPVADVLQKETPFGHRLIRRRASGVAS